jgi:hypothetical protein
MGKQKPIDNLRDGCLFTLKYFGLFSYPLTVGEIHRFNPFSGLESEVDKTLIELVSEGLIFYSNGFYLSKNDPAWITERVAGNKRAEKLMKKSGRYGSIIASFPFVRSITLSGSLSKFYASVDADIDYFIITEKNRLWIARTLLHLFKKLTFITGHQHYFCMNYFVDMEALEIQHKNEYSAIETVTLIPIYNDELVDRILQENHWTKSYLPNYPDELNKNFIITKDRQSVKKLFEFVINIFAPNRLNKILMKLTDRKWRRKWKRKGFDMDQYEKAFLTTVHISKNHPMDYENKVLTDLNKG